MASSQEDIELIAALVGTTNAELKKVDEQIVSSSANLQQSAAQWNPHGILKNHITGAPGQSAPVAPPENSYIPPDESTVQQMVPSGELPVELSSEPPKLSLPELQSQPISVGSNDQLDRIEKKLDTLLSRVDNIAILDKKFTNFIDRGLRDKVKQVTLKFDDNNAKK